MKGKAGPRPGGNPILYILLAISLVQLSGMAGCFWPRSHAPSVLETKGPVPLPTFRQSVAPPAASQVSAATSTLRLDPNRKFLYSGPHCTQAYSEMDLLDVFEAHRIEWSAMGKQQPWFSVITDPRWKGKADIPEPEKREFYEGSSTATVQLIKDLFTEHNVKFCNKALDFGCGLGRLSYMLAKQIGCSSVVGVDQSFWHLQTAKKEMVRLGQGDKTDFRLTGVDLLKTLRGDQFDFFLSLIVLQHMVPPLQVSYLEQICDAMKPGGHGLFQIPTMLMPEDNQFRCAFHSSIDVGGMQMHYLVREQVELVLSRRGCSVLKRFPMDAIGTNFGAEATSDAFFFKKDHAVPQV